jgi:hypothetical protein
MYVTEIPISFVYAFIYCIQPHRTESAERNSEFLDAYLHHHKIIKH